MFTKKLVIKKLKYYLNNISMESLKKDNIIDSLKKDNIIDSLKKDNIINSLKKDNIIKYNIEYPNYTDYKPLKCDDEWNLNEDDIEYMINFDKKRILLPFISNKDKFYKDVYIALKNKKFFLPRKTLNFNLPEFNTKCGYCIRTLKNETNVKSYTTTITGFEGANCDYPNIGKKCTFNNKYCLIVPSLHISFPWDDSNLEETKKNNLGSKYIFGFKGRERNIMLKILIAMYDRALDWANDELAKLYENGQLDKLYSASVCKLDSDGICYDREYVNKKASQGGAPIGTIFPFFHYPNGENHKLGRVYEHIHLQVPLRITDDGFSHNNLEKFRNSSKPWVGGLEFMENNITGYLNPPLVIGDNSGKSFFYTYYKLKNEHFLYDLNKEYNFEKKFNKYVIDLKNMKQNQNILDTVKSYYDEKSNLYLIKFPKDTIIYRGFHHYDSNKLNCRDIKLNSDPTNQFNSKYTWYASHKIAFTYAIRATKKVLKKIKMEGKDLDSLEVQKKVMEEGWGFLIGYKTTKDLYMIDLLNHHNLETILAKFDILNRSRKQDDPNFPKSYETYYPNKDNTLSEKMNKKNTDNIVRQLYNQRLSFKVATGYNINMMDQLKNLNTTAKKKYNLKDRFTSMHKNARCTRWLLDSNSEDKNKPYISHLYKDLNRVSAILNDQYMIDLISRVCGFVNSSESREVLLDNAKSTSNYQELLYKGNKIEFEETKNYHHISGYIGRTCPSLGTGYGSFHSELVIFSNLDNFRINNSLNNKDILIKETPDAEWATCYPNNSKNQFEKNDINNRIEKIFLKVGMLLWYTKYKFTGACPLDEKFDDDELLDCDKLMEEIKNNSNLIYQFNQKFKDCQELKITDNDINSLKNFDLY